MDAPMTVKELSDYLRLDRMTIYKMLKERSIPASRIGHQWRFFKEDIDEWIRSRRIDRQKTAILVGDDSDLKQLLADELPEDNYEIVTATSAREAAELASRQQFRLVFIKANQKGVDMFRRLRDVDASVPVVVAASSSESKLLGQMAEVGAFTLVKWPASDELVRGILDSALGGKSALR